MTLGNAGKQERDREDDDGIRKVGVLAGAGCRDGTKASADRIVPNHLRTGYAMFGRAVNTWMRRREFFSAGWALAGSVALSARGASGSAPADPRPPLAVGEDKQLFIDGRFIAHSENVALAMNPAQKLGIVLDSAKEPWVDRPGGYFRVVEDAGKFKMYYGSFLEAGKGLCYAESGDGLRWTRPPLGLVEVQGSLRNNVIYADNAIDATIMVDPVDRPERRYKLFRSRVTDDPATAGIYASYSADGIHFTEAGRVLPMWPETSIVADWDARIGKYVVFLRVFVRDGQNQRRVGRLETDDLLKPWPYRPTSPLLSPPSPANIPQVLFMDAQDGQECDIYTGGACIYPHAQDAYLMFFTPFRHFSPRKQPWFRFEPGNDYGLIEVQMAVSRDGIRWSRPDRRPYFPMGLPDEWDRWLNLMGVGMLRQGNYLYQYYWSTGRTHDSGVLRPEYDRSVEARGAIGAVRQRLDGFVSADFSHAGGKLRTPQMIFSGKGLRLNIDTGAMGTAFVGLIDAQGKPVPGFGIEECDEIGGNFVDVAVRWRGRGDLSALRGTPISLEFAARSAKLYAFQFLS